MNKLRITQVKSAIGYNKKQRATLRGLGIRRMNQTVELDSTPPIRGMVDQVIHLVKVEEV